MRQYSNRSANRQSRATRGEGRACLYDEVTSRILAELAEGRLIGGDKAFYRPSADFVQVPPQPLFFDQINFYRTVFHELTHATGHAARLARPMDDPFGSPGYAREELVAEMGSAFLCAALGIVPTVRHSDYIGAWFEVLARDNRAIFRAASQASKAADWLLARHAEANARETGGESAVDGEFADAAPSAPAQTGEAA